MNTSSEVRPVSDGLFHGSLFSSNKIHDAFNSSNNIWHLEDSSKARGQGGQNIWWAVDKHLGAAPLSHRDKLQGDILGRFATIVPVCLGEFQSHLLWQFRDGKDYINRCVGSQVLNLVAADSIWSDAVIQRMHTVNQSASVTHSVHILRQLLERLSI